MIRNKVDKLLIEQFGNEIKEETTEIEAKIMEETEKKENELEKEFIEEIDLDMQEFEKVQQQEKGEPQEKVAVKKKRASFLKNTFSNVKESLRNYSSEIINYGKEIKKDSTLSHQTNNLLNTLKSQSFSLQQYNLSLFSQIRISFVFLFVLELTGIQVLFFSFFKIFSKNFSNYNFFFFFFFFCKQLTKRGFKSYLKSDIRTPFSYNDVQKLQVKVKRFGKIKIIIFKS